MVNKLKHEIKWWQLWRLQLQRKIENTLKSKGNSNACKAGLWKWQNTSAWTKYSAELLRRDDYCSQENFPLCSMVAYMYAVCKDYQLWHWHSSPSKGRVLLLTWLYKSGINSWEFLLWLPYTVVINTKLQLQRRAGVTRSSLSSNSVMP